MSRCTNSYSPALARFHRLGNNKTYNVRKIESW